MRKLFVVFLVAILALGSLTNVSTSALASRYAAQVLWQKGFHGLPKTNIVYLEDEAIYALGTDEGVVFLGESGVSAVAYVGDVMSGPVIVQGTVYVSTINEIFGVSSDGTIIRSFSVGNVKGLLGWNGYLAINSIQGSESMIIVQDANIELEPKIVVDYMCIGDIDGSSPSDIILGSIVGDVIAYSWSGNVLLNVSVDLDTGVSEYISDIVVGNVVSGGHDDVILGTRARYSPSYGRLAIINGTELIYLNLSRGVMGLSLYDFDGDGYQDIIVGTDFWVAVIRGYDLTTLYNITTQGFEEGFREPIFIKDIDSDGKLEILYIGGKGSLIILNTTRVENILNIPNESFLTFSVGGSKVLLVTRTGKIFITDNGDSLRYSFRLLPSIASIYPVAYGRGPIIAKLSSGDLAHIASNGTLSILNITSVAGMLYGDIDGDGIDEGILLSYSEGSTKIFVMYKDNTTLYLFATIDDIARYMSVVDFDGDGKDEVILSAEDSVYVVGYSNTTKINITEPLLSYPPAIYDIDNDLSLDIVVVGASGAIYTINSSFVPRKLISLSIIPDSPLIVGDVNMDRGADYITFHGSSIYCVDSSGQVKFIISKGNISMYPYPKLTDIDADGYLDLVVAAGNKILVFDNEGNLKGQYDIGSKVYDFAIVDLGYDWIQDLVVATKNKIEIINMLTKDVELTISSKYILGKAFILAGDFDGNGKANIIVVSAGVINIEVNTSINGVANGLGVNKLMNFNTMNYDRDMDNLTEYQEQVIYHTNPYLKDTDGDGYDDYTEVTHGWNPKDPSSPSKLPIFWISLILSVVAVAVIFVILYVKPRLKK